MAKKKSSSVFFEPYNLLLILGQSAALLFSSVAQAFKDVRSNSEESDFSDEESKAAYAATSAEFDTPEFEKNWKTFLQRALCVQGILLFLTLAHALFGNFFMSVQLLLVFTASIIFFGYKPWVRRNKRVVSFMTYLRKDLWRDPKSMLLWINLKEKQ